MALVHETLTLVPRSELNEKNNVNTHDGEVDVFLLVVFGCFLFLCFINLGFVCYGNIGIL